MRWVVLAFVAGGIMAVSIPLIVQGQVDRAKARAAAEAAAMTARMEAPDRAVTAPLDQAAAVARQLIAHVGAGRFAEARALMAEPYRRAASVEKFTAACQASVMLSTGRALTLQELRRTSAAGASTIQARGVLASAAGAVPATFVFTEEPGGPRILVVSLAGIPVLQAITR